MCLSRGMYLEDSLGLRFHRFLNRIIVQVATGKLPYAHRWDDRAVTIDIMRGVKPSRGAFTACKIPFTDLQKGMFWDILNWCWDGIPSLRPSMTEVKGALAGVVGHCA